MDDIISIDPVSRFNPWGSAFTVDLADVCNTTGLAEMRRIAKAQSESPAPKVDKAPTNYLCSSTGSQIMIIEPYPYTFQAERIKLKTPWHGGGWFEGHALTAYRGRWSTLFVALEMRGQAIGIPPSQIEEIQMLKRGKWWNVPVR